MDRTDRTGSVIGAKVVRGAPARPADYRFLGTGISGSCLVGAEETGGIFSVFELFIEPGAGVPPHIHSVEEETFYALEGTFEVQRGTEIIEMAAGMSLFGPRGIVHGFRAVGEKPGRCLVVTTPGGFENFFRDLNDAADVLSAPGEAAFARIGALMEKYGMQPSSEPDKPVTKGHLPPNRFVGLGNHRGHVLVPGEETKGTLILANLEVDPKGGPPPHRHTREDEAFYILEGRFTVLLGEEIVEVGPGDFVFAPRGIAHGWTNDGDTPAYALALIAPSDNFQEFALSMEKLIGQIPENTAPQNIPPTLLQEIASLHQRHAIELVAPVGVIK
jgi:quercetin dioxygenase-like cupin family protein